MSESGREGWIVGVALTTAVLAVCTAISSLKASGYSTRIQVSTTMEANRWAYYQAKSIKEHSFRLQKDVFEMELKREAGNPEVRGTIEEKIAQYDGEIARYGKEKDEIKDDAERLVRETEVLKLHNTSFALAVMLLQVAILLSSVGALIRKKIMWFVGLLFGLFGLCYMVNGFLLWF